MQPEGLAKNMQGEQDSGWFLSTENPSREFGCRETFSDPCNFALTVCAFGWNCLGISLEVTRKVRGYLTHEADTSQAKNWKNQRGSP